MKGQKSMRIFLVGDDWSGTGPANATLALRKCLPSDTLFLKSKWKLTRLTELIYKMGKADAVVFSGHSRQNILGMRLARKKHIPSIYIMHGCVEHEGKINHQINEALFADERTMMQEADLLLAVSEQFEVWLKENYPQYESKISHLTNGIDWKRFENKAGSNIKDRNAILSVGGGMPRKRIVRICEAVALLREKACPDLKLIVAGDFGEDSDRINGYDFVENVGLIDRAEMDKIYAKSCLFVQNSVFETFGLAAVEALLSGCDILLSKNCGVLSVLGGIEKGDIIEDTEDAFEIAYKIQNLLKSGNCERILKGTDKESTSWERRSMELIGIAERLLDQGSL